MKVSKTKLMAVAQPLSENGKRKMQQRRADRYWKAASSAIAAKIIRQLGVLGLTRVQLAEKLGITPANITRYLSGTTNFELNTLVEIERVLGINIIDRNVIPQNEFAHVKVVVEYSTESCAQSSVNITKLGKSKFYDYA